MDPDPQSVPSPPADHDADRDEERVHSRSHLLPEEAAGGVSDDPVGQAKIILEDSAARTEDPDAASTTFVEHRSSEDIV